MGLFSRKARKTVEVVCHEYYDDFMLGLPVAGVVDGWADWLKVGHRQIVEADLSFGEVEHEAFTREMTAVRLELFALAFLHEADRELSPRQGMATRRYLETHGSAAFWHAMQKYNKAISRSCVHGASQETPGGRVRITAVTLARANAAKAWLAQGLDEESIARAANRLGTVASWDGSPLPAYLTAAMLEAVGADLTQQAAFWLQALMFGLYDGARRALRLVRVEG